MQEMEINPIPGPGLQHGYCLSGEVGGARRLYRIQAGANPIGNRLSNTIVLPALGVSRQHAEIRLEGDRLSIYDQGSTNGTFVNGDRVVGETPVAPGDRIGLGPVELEIERRDGEDLTLAFTVDKGEPSPLPELGEEATEPLASFGGASPTDLMESFIEQLSASPEGPAAAALAAVAAREGLSDGCIVVWDGLGEPVLLAAVGELDGGALHRYGRPLFKAAKLSAAREGFWHIATLGDGLLTCAVLAEAGSLPLALVLPGRALERSEPRVARTMLRLVGLLHRTASSPTGAEGGGGLPSSLVFPEDYVVGRSAAMTELYRQMRCLLQGAMPILLLGETGVGKEHLAQILHRSSDRSSGPYIVVNCGAVPGELLETEMFGIASGVATGVAERPGRFRQAHGGTLFLDEIDSMPRALQVKLLRAIEASEIQPVGGDPQALDVRIVAATNGDLSSLIEEGSFRRDLYYRLAGYELRVPPLRERRDDIPSLVEHFVCKFIAETGKSLQGMTLAAMRDLVRRTWVGNVRELRHEVRRLVYFCPDGEAIRTFDQPKGTPEGSCAGWVESHMMTHGHLNLQDAVASVEEQVIRLTLRRTSGNKTEAARLLGISRNGLRMKLRRLNLSEGSDSGA